MKVVQLLGVSEDTSSVIFDIVKETTKEPLFIFFPNIKDLVEPFTPIQTVNYKIMPLGIAPDSNNLVFFGTAGPKNKIAILIPLKKNMGSLKITMIKSFTLLLILPLLPISKKEYL